MSDRRPKYKNPIAANIYTIYIEYVIKKKLTEEQSQVSVYE